MSFRIVRKDSNHHNLLVKSTKSVSVATNDLVAGQSADLTGVSVNGVLSMCPVLVGEGANTIIINNTSAVSVGCNARAGRNSVALGNDTLASGPPNFGNNASIAIGRGADADVGDLAIGSNAYPLTTADPGTHDTENKELRVIINGDTYYLKLYTI